MFILVHSLRDGLPVILNTDHIRAIFVESGYTRCGGIVDIGTGTPVLTFEYPEEIQTLLKTGDEIVFDQQRSDELHALINKFDVHLSNELYHMRMESK